MKCLTVIRSAGFTLLLILFSAGGFAQEKPVPAPPQSNSPKSKVIGGGGIMFTPSFYRLSGGSPAFGFMIGGGGYAEFSGFRIGGFGGKISFDPNDGWMNNIGFGAILTGYDIFVTRWLDISATVLIGFGRGDFHKLVLQDPEYYPNPKVLTEEYLSWLFFLSPMIGLEFIVVRWLKIGLVASFTYSYAQPESLIGAGGGISLFFGNFRK